MPAHVLRALVAAGTSLALAGCDFQTLGPDCPPRAASFDLNTSPGPRPTVTRLAVGETRTLNATVQDRTRSCSYSGLPVTHIQWADTKNTEPKVQVHLAGCSSCALLYQDARSPSGYLRGAARVDGDRVEHVTLELRGLAPGQGTLTLWACSDEYCQVNVSDETLVIVE